MLVNIKNIMSVSKIDTNESTRHKYYRDGVVVGYKSRIYAIPNTSEDCYGGTINKLSDLPDEFICKDDKIYLKPSISIELVGNTILRYYSDTIKPIDDLYNNIKKYNLGDKLFLDLDLVKLGFYI